MVVHVNVCRRFQANMFSKTRCQNCFKPKDGHSGEALELAKMNRKVTASGFLYVAPPNIDFSQPAHSTRRWQRRCFKLYDDGELSYAIDDNPDTVPHMVMNMSRCTRVCEADAITAHQHSILLAFKVDDIDPDSKEKHVPICYLKADTTEEIRWWQNFLQSYVKQNLQSSLLTPVRRKDCAPTAYTCDSLNPRPSTMYQSLKRSESAPRENVSSLSSSADISQDNCLSTKLENCVKGSFGDTYHGTPRSVKFRNKVYKEEPQRKPMGDVQPTSETLLPLPESPCPATQITTPFQRKPPATVPFNIDTSNIHTLRKGWLTLRGKNETEWTKHWVVLAGLSLKLYKDVWAEDSEPLLSVDLTECENVYPSSSARNYGIEIKCRRTRYILSAMTPGIRDSWIAALQQNLHNPSPTYADACQSDVASLNDSDLVSLPPRKKHIAYVAPESHHSNSMMDDDSCTEDELNSIGSRALPSQQMSASERSLESSDDELLENGRRNRHCVLRSRGTREHSLSPTFRRSPVSRIKERSTTRQHYVGMGRHGSNSSLSSAPVYNERSRRKNSRTSRGEASPQEMRLRLLEEQVQTLRDQLHDTTCRLGETQTENERLRYLFMSNDSRGLSQLRKSLTAAEQDVIKKQAEMENLRKQLVTPTTEIGGGTSRCVRRIVERFVALLKVQVGALSKFLHSNSDTREFTSLRQTTDRLIRAVASLSDNKSLTSGASSDISEFSNIENVLEQVSDAYKQLTATLNLQRPLSKEQGTLTDVVVKKEGVDLEIKDVDSMREKIADIQACHAEEIESLRLQYERQLRTLRERAEYEEQRRRKAQDELKTLNAMSENSIQAMKKGHEELLAEQKCRFDQEMSLLKEDHAAELQEEKEATRMALDAVQRSHDAEVKHMAEKIRSLSASLASCQANVSESRYEAQASRQSKMLEQMSAELAQLSALYSAKCVENSQLDEKMSLLLADKENQASTSDADAQNRRLMRELKQKDATIEELFQQINALEKRLAELTGEEEISDKNGEPGRELLETPDVPQVATVLKPSSQVRSPSPPKTGLSSAAPQNVRLRKIHHCAGQKTTLRRNDTRFHSNPSVSTIETVPDHLTEEARKSLAIPVSERRKFFETIG